MFRVKYIIAFLVFLLGLFLFPQTIHAQTTDLLIGLQRISLPVDGYSLNTVDPTNGQKNVLTNLPSPSLQASESTFDSSTNQFFVQDCPGSFGTPCQLITLDGNTGSVINSVATPHIVGLHVSINKKLIGFERIISPVNGYRLLTIDPINGQITTIGYYANPNFVPSEAAYDFSTNQFFVQDCPGSFGTPCQLLTIDTSNGAIVNTVAAPRITGLHVNGSILIGLQRIITPINGYSLNTVDPTNGQTTTIGYYANPNFVPNEAAFSQTNYVLYVQDCPGSFGTPCSLYSILTTTGGVLGQVSSPRVNGLHISVPTFVNTPPIVETVIASPNPVEVNTSVTVTATFTDVNISDTHTATANWGDNSSSTSCTISESNGAGTAICLRTSGYALADIYSPIITVTDNHAAYGDSPPYEYLSVYNPTNQGLFSGASKFTTPAGSYPTNIGLSGQVKFGITAKYDNNNLPTGNVSMKFDAAGIEFESTSITVLVTANGKATLRGTGTINGVGNYNFLVTGLDSGTDKIRFQIKDGSTVVYDSQIGAADTVDPTATVTGQVIVH